MKKGVVLINFLLILVLSFSTFISAVQLINPNDTFIQEKMVLNLSELFGFTYGGYWAFPPEISYYHIDLRYLSPIDNDQHSEYLLEIFNSPEETNIHFNNRVFLSMDLWNLSIQNLNGNKIFLGISGEQRYFLWISENNVIQGWNGNDIGTVIDDALFDTLTDSYLEKYPSTYAGENSSLCKDSDAGLNYGVKGTVRGFLGMGNVINYTDYCFETSSNFGTVLHEAVMESYCKLNGEPTQMEYLCLNGCRDGACIEPVCSDGTPPKTKICDLTFNKGSDSAMYTYYYKYCNENENCPTSNDITSLGCTNPSAMRPSAILCFSYNNGPENCYDSDFCPLLHEGPMGSDINPTWETGPSLLSRIVNFFKRLFGG